jgi:hypothetical protein
MVADNRKVLEVKRKVLTHAVMNADLTCLMVLSKKGMTALNSILEDGADSRFSYLLPSAEEEKSEAFERYAARIPDKFLTRVRIPAEIGLDLAMHAIASSKFSIASMTLKSLGSQPMTSVENAGISERYSFSLKGRFVMHLVERGLEGLGAGAGNGQVAEAVRTLVLAAYLRYDPEVQVCPHFQILGPQRHKACFLHPEKCATRKEEKAIIDEGIGYLLDSAMIAHEIVSRVPETLRRKIFRRLAEVRDTDYAEFCRRYAEASASAVAGRTVEAHAGLTGTEEPETPGLDRLRELSSAHPVSALLTCIQMENGLAYIVPVIREGRPLGVLLDLITASSAAQGEGDSSHA